MTCKRTQNRLLEYSHGELDAPDAAATEAHLSRCETCADALRQLERTACLLGSLERKDAPFAVRAAIEAHIDRPPASRSWYSGVSKPLTAALVIVVTLLGGGLYWLDQPAVHLVGIEATTTLERQARTLHRQRLAGTLELQIRTPDVAALRRWSKQTHGVPLELSSAQPPSTASRIQVIGAVGTSSDNPEEQSGVFVALRIDERPVSLLVSKKSHDSIPEGRFSKNIFYGREGSNHALIWSRKDRSYVLISDLPNQGRMGCLGCHTGAERRRLIKDMKLRS